MAYIGKSPDGTGVRSRFYYTQTSGGGTSVSGSSDDGTTLTFSDGAYVDVYLNGVLLVAGTDYNTSTANTIAGLAALANGDVVEVVVYDIFTVADTVSSLNGGTFSNNVTINGDLTVDTNTLFVDASADAVGINTTSPDTALHVKSSNDTVAVIESTDATSKLQLKDNSSTNGASLAVTNETFSIQVNGGTRATIDSSGNVLVGTTTDTGGRVNITNAGIILRLNTSNTSNTAVQFVYNGSSQVGSITTDTSSTNYGSGSDYRLKENVADMTGAIARVKQLAPKRFNFIVDADKTVDGFLAHEAQTVVPEAVTGTHNEVDDDGNPVMQGIDQSKLVPLLTGALREAIAKIETLETKVAALEAGS